MPDFSIFIIPLASNSDSDSAALIPLVLCLSGFIYYTWIYLKYRNTDKRHHHENETMATVQQMQQLDQLVEHRLDLRSSSMSGNNSSQIEGSLSQSDGVPKTIKNLGGAIGILKDE